MTQDIRGRGPCQTLAALVGVAALFAYYRSASFMGAVFSTAPAHDAAAGWAIHPGMPLAALAISAVLLMRGGHATAALAGPLPTLAAGCLGSLGAALELLVRTGLLPEGWTIAAALLCACSFIYATVLSGIYLCAMDTVRMAGVVVVGYLAAYGVFVTVRQTPAIQVLALVTPLVATVPWMLWPPSQDQDGAPWTRAQAVAVLRSPLLWLLFLLLAASSAIRSLLGEETGPSVFRTWTHVALSGAFVVAWAIGAFRGSRNPAARDRSVLSAIGICAVLVVVVFLAAVFPYLAQGQRSSVYLIASARAVLDAVWLVALCAWVRSKGAPVVPAFLVWGAGAWAVQWLECYWVLPYLLFGDAGVLPQAVVAGAVLLLTLALLALCGLLAVPTLRGGADALRPPSEPEPPATDDRPDRLAALGLTPREAEVALLFAQGYSIGGVADQLGMSKSTAQSHSKAIYRKLDIHTKDELIALVAKGAR